MHVVTLDFNAKVCNKLYIARKRDWRWTHVCRKWCNESFLKTGEGINEKIVFLHPTLKICSVLSSIVSFADCRVKFCSLKLMRCFCDWRIPIIVHETKFLKSEDEKQMGMLVVSLVNFGCWSRLGCSGHSTNILSRQETPNDAKRNSSQIFFLSCFVFVFVCF